jgi:hypothetical protein
MTPLAIPSAFVSNYSHNPGQAPPRTVDNRVF